MGHTIQETTVTVFIGNYIRGVNVIKGSLYSRVYGITLPAALLLDEILADLACELRY